MEIPVHPAVAVGAATVVALGLSVMLPASVIPDVNVAFIGNSMQYYNDLPRFMEELSDGHLQQNSCLHGNSRFASLLTMGNGMYSMWNTGNARIEEDGGYYSGSSGLNDYGACTVAQLFFGYDADLTQRLEEAAVDDDGFDKAYGDDFFNYFDGTNPCLRDADYYDYLQSKYETEGTPSYDYVVMNDNTRSPARETTREESLEVLEQVYAPWFLEMGATPILLCTYAYWTPYRDMQGLGTIPEFTSLTYEGYKQYAKLLEENLPASQKPRIAPVGLAFLIVWEENHDLWLRLFHVDLIHTSPIGTYLQGCVVHHAIFGRMPKIDVAVRGDMFTLWMRARRFQPGNHRTTPFPTEEEAAYLYHVAKRVTVYGHKPKSLIEYSNGEAAEAYDLQDDLYKVDDLF